MQEVFLSNIYIKDVYHLKDIELNIDKKERKHFIITGRNGSGKSILAQAISDYLATIYNGDLFKIDTWKKDLHKWNTMLIQQKKNLDTTVDQNSRNELLNNIQQVENTYGQSSYNAYVKTQQDKAKIKHYSDNL